MTAVGIVLSFRVVSIEDVPNSQTAEDSFAGVTRGIRDGGECLAWGQARVSGFARHFFCYRFNRRAIA